MRKTRSDPSSFFDYCKKVFVGLILKYWHYLNNYFTNLRFSKEFSRALYRRFFDCRNLFHAGGVRFDPPLKSPIFIVRRFNFDFLHRIKFLAALICSQFQKISFRLVLAIKFQFGRGLDLTPVCSLYELKSPFWSHYKIHTKSPKGDLIIIIFAQNHFNCMF